MGDKGGVCMRIDLVSKFFSSITLILLFFAFAGALPAQADSNARKGLPIELVISPEELRQKQLSGQQFLLLDARSPKHYRKGHIEGAILPLPAEYYDQQELFKNGQTSRPPDTVSALAQTMSRYPKSTPIVAYSMVNCQASAALVMNLKRLGFVNLKDMEEGIEVWEQKGYSVVK